jgi:hypothetical protein
MTSGYLRKLFTGLIVGAALFVVWIATTIAVGAAEADADAPICINYTTCYDSNTGMLVSNPNQNPAPTTYAPSTVAYAPGQGVYVPTQTAYTPTATGYPPNTTISVYPDPRYCGGFVAVVTDSSGNLINVCPGTGQRVYPFFPDYGTYGYYNGYYGGPTVYNAYTPWAWGGYYGYGANYCGTGLYAPQCPNVPSIQPAPQTNVVVGTRIVPVTVKSASEPVPAPVAAPQPAPAAPVVTQVDAAPQPAPAQVVTSLSAAQQPAAPQAPVAAPLAEPTSGGGSTHIQGTATTVVAAPSVDPGNDDHRG